MPRTHYSEAIIQKALELYKSLESTGHHLRHGVKIHMARILSYSGAAIYQKDVNNILDILQGRGLIGSHHTIANPDNLKRGESGKSFKQALEKDRLREAVNGFKTPREMTITSGVHRILAIPDSHASVHLDNERFSWAGKLAADRKVDIIVQIGDFCCWDSFSSHERPGTVAYANKPNFETEFAVFHDALKRISEEFPKKYNPRKYITLGNHSQRIYNYQDQNPACGEIFSSRVEGAFESFGWQISPYGAKVYIEGVMFTHKPFNTMGRPESMPTIEREAICDIYTGHDHRYHERVIPKHDGKVTIISGGVFLPDGYLPKYAQYSLSGWTYGCQILTVENGRIREVERISMNTLGELYGQTSRAR